MPVTAQLTRRGVLQAAAVAPIALLAACGSSEEGSATDADESVRQAVAADEQDLIRRYDATLAAYPSLAPQLQSIRDQHSEHLSAAGGLQSSDSPAANVPKTASAAIQELAAAERKAATARTKSCGAATGAELIWNLALIASSESQHAAILVKAQA